MFHVEQQRESPSLCWCLALANAPRGRLRGGCALLAQNARLFLCHIAAQACFTWNIGHAILRRITFVQQTLDASCAMVRTGKTEIALLLPHMSPSKCVPSTGEQCFTWNIATRGRKRPLLIPIPSFVHRTRAALWPLAPAALARGRKVTHRNLRPAFLLLFHVKHSAKPSRGTRARPRPSCSRFVPEL